MSFKEHLLNIYRQFMNFGAINKGIVLFCLAMIILLIVDIIRDL